MICVFSAFILSGQQITGEFGLGLAGAVLLDAFLLRTLLVPALMHLAGLRQLVAARPGWTASSRTCPSNPPPDHPPSPAAASSLIHSTQSGNSWRHAEKVVVTFDDCPRRDHLHNQNPSAASTGIRRGRRAAGTCQV